MTLYDQIREQADTIEMLSGQRPVGIRLTKRHLEMLKVDPDSNLMYNLLTDSYNVLGLRIEVIDDNRKDS